MRKYKKEIVLLPEYFTSYQSEILVKTLKLIDDNLQEREMINYLSSKLVLNSLTNSLSDFLLRIPSKFLKFLVRSSSDLELVIKDTINQYDNDFENIEIFFCPKSIENEWISDDEIVDTFSRVWKELSTSRRLSFVLSLRRNKEDLSVDYVTKVVKEYSKYSEKGISKLDICSDEEAVSYKDLEQQLNILKESRQQLTLHLGETTSRDMNYILDNFPMVKQFNHGIQAAFDKSLIEKIKRNDVLLTICPLSNIYTGVLAQEKVLEAIRVFKDNNVRYVICSDDATIIEGNVKAPYVFLNKFAPDLIQ
jgi:adenosine deaminase